MPTAASSAPAIRAASRASACEPPPPRAIAPGTRVAGSPTRQTMPCSWSVEMSAGTGVGWASAACWMPLESAAICCGSRVLWAQEK